MSMSGSEFSFGKGDEYKNLRQMSRDRLDQQGEDELEREANTERNTRSTLKQQQDKISIWWFSCENNHENEIQPEETEEERRHNEEILRAIYERIEEFIYPDESSYYSTRSKSDQQSSYMQGKALLQYRRCT